MVGSFYPDKLKNPVVTYFLIAFALNRIIKKEVDILANIAVVFSC